jgi:hypothetical protein
MAVVATSASESAARAEVAAMEAAVSPKSGAARSEVVQAAVVPALFHRHFFRFIPVCEPAYPSLESLEKTVFSFASSAGLTYPMDNLSRERSFIP